MKHVPIPLRRLTGVLAVVVMGTAGWRGTWAGPTTQPAASQPAVTATVNSVNWITLTWTPVAGVVHYEVFRGRTPDVPMAWETHVGPPGLNKPTWEDDRLDPNTQYYYKVCAVGPAPGFVGTYIGAASAKTPSDAVP